MTQYADAKGKKVVRQRIQDGRTLKCLAAEYGVSIASISNWIHAYLEECQTNDEEKTQLEPMEKVRKLRQEKQNLKRKMTS